MLIYKLYKKPFFGRYQKPWRWPKDYTEKDSWEDVSFRSKSRSVLKGLYGSSKINSAKGSIVCAHPMGVSAKGYFLRHGIADLLRDEGYNVLLFDFNGFGDSTDGDYNLPEDVIAAGKFLQEKTPELSIGFYGISFGASMAVCAFSKDTNPYKSAVFESAFTSLVEFWASFGLLGQFIKLFPILIPRLEKKMNSLHNAGSIKNTEKILWIHGNADKLTPVEMGNRFVEKCNVKSDLWIVPEGKHANCYNKSKDAYNVKLLSFFGESLC